MDSGQREGGWRGCSGGESCTKASEKLWRDHSSAQQMKETAEQTQKRTKAAEETLRDQQISQGKKTKGTKFNRGRKDASAGPGAGYKYTFKATSSRKKGRIIHCLPRCRTERDTGQKEAEAASGCWTQRNRVVVATGQASGSLGCRCHS